MIHFPFYNIVTAFLGICTASFILYLVRRDKLSVNYTLWWGFLALGLIVFGSAPALIDWIGKKLGVAYPPILFVIIAICLIFVKLLFMDLHRSRHEQQIRILTQRLALYENENKKTGR
ncbi:MAG: DUF2304 domain-containing protein [Desulfosalsimonadaceae bacterium]